MLAACEKFSATALFWGRQEMEEGGGGIGCLHEMLADKEGIEAGGAEMAKIGMGAQARFGHGDAVIGDLLDQFQRGLRVHREGLQIAIVYADDMGFGGEGAIELGACVDFNQRFHLQCATEGDEVAQQRIVESGNDQEEAIGVVGARFPDLPGIEDEVLAENRERDFLASITKILEGAAKEFTFGKNGKSGSARGFEGFGERGSVEGVANYAAGRRSWF